MPGISRTSLWRSWKEVRKKLRDASIRDVVDYVDWDMEADVWIPQLVSAVQDGKYEPSRPARFTLGKSKGFSRWMTMPSIPDLVLYHSIATRIAERAGRRRRAHRHVYFLRDRISAVQKDAAAEAVERVKEMAPYRTGFLAWLRFHEYRRHLLLKRVHPFIVVTDVSNFFDSVVHTQLESCLTELGFQRNVVGLLLLLLERLSIREAYSRFPSIGLPVDEFDCSRSLAHVVLFPHDDRMVERVGESAYVRWMDDQTFGVPTEAEAVHLLAAVNASLRRMHLVPNAGKTRILTLSMARRHFHLDFNDALSKLQQRVDSLKSASGSRRRIRELWERFSKHQGVGEWDKVLKRFYLLGGLLRQRFLIHRTHRDLLDSPSMARRVLAYLRAVCAPAEFLDRVRAVLEDERLVYPDVRRVVAEELLRAEPSGVDVRDFRSLARSSLHGKRQGHVPPDAAALLILRFGDARSARTVFKQLVKSGESGREDRAAALVFASYGSAQAAATRRLAQERMTPQLVRVARFLEIILSLRELPGRVKARLNLRFDSVAGKKYLDMRSLLIARLFSLNPRIRTELTGIARDSWIGKLSSFDDALVRRLLGLRRGRKTT